MLLFWKNELTVAHFAPRVEIFRWFFVRSSVNKVIFFSKKCGDYGECGEHI